MKELKVLKKWKNLKYKKNLTILLSALCISAMSACGGTAAANTENTALTESVALAESTTSTEPAANSEAPQYDSSVASVVADNISAESNAPTGVKASLSGGSVTAGADNNISQQTQPQQVQQPTESHQTQQPSQTQQQTQPTKPQQVSPTANTTDANSGVVGTNFAGTHGALHLDGTKLVDQNGSPIQLYGMSTHGLAWFPDYVNYDGFKTLRDDWNTNCVRLAMYPHEYGGYCTGGDQNNLKALVRTGVDAATDLGMYVIIDWHVLQEQDPNVYKEQAKGFFQEMSSTYADHTNVLYEICNEPNGSTSWDSVKSYAEEVIPVIRANDPDAVIIVGTPTWCQDIDKAKANPLDFDNVMYALHFYAGTHKDVLWNRLDSCVQNGLPVFISEFGMCDASGNGANDFDSTQNWFNVIERYNLSFCCWNLANKNESSSVISSSCSKTSCWSENELSEAGKWFRDYCRRKGNITP